MFFLRVRSKTGALFVLLTVVSVYLAGCATRPVAPVSQFEDLAGAITVPYQISDSGRLLVNVSINEGPARPMSVDTGATVSVIYGDFAAQSNLTVSDRTRFVRGLVAQGDRPVIKDVEFQIGGKTERLDEVVMLATPSIQDEAIGLLGGDILRRYTVVFNRETLRVSFIPNGQTDRSAFSGWTRIPLRRLTQTPADTGLYFAVTALDGDRIPVLIDTGSNLNFINWKLATLDESIRRLERRLIRNGTLQGALDSTSATLETTFYDLKLGGQYWDEVPVIVTGLGGLADIAPTDKPFMVAGANLFAPHTLALDLAGLMLYLHPETGL